MDAKDGEQDAEGAEAPADDAPPSLIARLLHTWIGLSMKLAKGGAAMKEAAVAGMTVQQITAIHVLMFEGPCSITQLTERLGLSASATSHLVQRLVEQGVARRFEDETDRRSKLVSVTPEGKKFVERMMKARLEELKVSVSHLSSALRHELKPLLERVVDELSWKTGEQWARRASVKPRDYRHKHMCGSDFAGRDLSGAVFTDARVDGSDCAGCTFTGANFDDARVDGSDLDGANFTGASLKDARLDSCAADGAVFDGADLTNARLDSCSLDGARFDGCVAHGTRFDDSSLDGASFNGADLKDARMDGCSLDGASFKGAINVPHSVAGHINADGLYEE